MDAKCKSSRVLHSSVNDNSEVNGELDKYSIDIDSFGCIVLARKRGSFVGLIDEPPVLSGAIELLN